MYVKFLNIRKVFPGTFMKKTQKLLLSLLCAVPLFSSCSVNDEDTPENRLSWYLSGYVMDMNVTFGYLSHDLYDGPTKVTTTVVEDKTDFLVSDDEGNQTLETIEVMPITSLYIVNDDACYSDITTSGIGYRNYNQYVYTQETKSYSDTSEIANYIDCSDYYRQVTKTDEGIEYGSVVYGEETYTKQVYTGYSTYSALLAGDDSLFESMESECTDVIEDLIDDLFNYNSYTEVDLEVDVGTGYIDFKSTQTYFTFSARVIEGRIDTDTGYMEWRDTYEEDYDYYEVALADSRIRHTYRVTEGTVEFASEAFDIDFTTEGKEYESELYSSD